MVLYLWLQVQIFYDHIDCTTQMGIDYAAGGILRKLRPDKAWATIERLAQYEDEGWNDAFILVEMSLNYENPDIEQLLGIMERKVDTLMKDAISLMGRSKRIFRMTTNEIKRQRSTRGQSSSAQEVSNEEKVRRLGLFENGVHQLNYDTLARYDPNHVGVRFRIGGEQKEISLLELGWRVGLYSKRQSRENATLSGLRNGETVKESRLLMEFWPTIGDGGFNVGNTKLRDALSIEPLPRPARARERVNCNWVGARMELCLPPPISGIYTALARTTSGGGRRRSRGGG
ncbi:hypothetical protein Tco_0189345 [Tanacetum coccineum]